MANINLSTGAYARQFAAFESFATIRNKGTVASIGDVRELKSDDVKWNSIEIKKMSDGYGRFWRSDESKDINNAVRDLFKRTVLAVCGVESIDKLPRSVLAVMKASDYDGNGHPLTARRITAVTKAIRQAAELDDEGKFIDVKDEPVEVPKVVEKGDVTNLAEIEAKVKVYREDPKYKDVNGDLVADAIIATVKAFPEKVSANDIEILEPEELAKLKNETITIYSTTDFTQAGPRVEANEMYLKRIDENALCKVKKLYSDDAGTPIMTAIKKNLISQYSLASANRGEFWGIAANLRIDYDELVKTTEYPDTLDLVATAVNKSDIAKDFKLHVKPAEA